MNSKFVIVTTFTCLITFVVWGSSIGKLFAVAVAAMYLAIKTKRDPVEIIVFILICSIYLLNHHPDELHHFKIFLVAIQLLILNRIVDHATRKSFPIDSKMIYEVIPIFLTISIIFVGAGIGTNIAASEFDRYRGAFLFPLVALLFISSEMSRRRAIAMALLISAIGYILSGSRGASLSLLLIALCTTLRPKASYYAMPAAVLFPQIAAYLYYAYSDWGESHNNISIRALSQTYVVENITLFGAGITPPLREFFSRNYFEHFFVPADVGFLGLMYEVGFVVFVLKLAYVAYMFHTRPGIRDTRLAMYGVSVFLFEYGLTYDVIVVAFSLIAYEFASRRSQSNAFRLTT